MNVIESLLVVDDDIVFQELTQEVVENSKRVKKLEFFSNGQEAINYLKSIRHSPEQLPDVIMLDLNMPILDGWGFLKEYEKLDKLPHIITIFIVSSSIDPDDIERAMNLHMVKNFIIKPVTIDKFLDMLSQL